MSPRQFRRLEARVRMLRVLCRAAFFVLCVSCGFLFVAPSFAQREALADLTRKLEGTRKQEGIVYGELDQARMEYRALKEDPAFLEIQARDRLDYYREGEKVFRFRRSE